MGEITDRQSKWHGCSFHYITTKYKKIIHEGYSIDILSNKLKQNQSKKKILGTRNLDRKKIRCPKYFFKPKVILI